MCISNKTQLLLKVLTEELMLLFLYNVMILNPQKMGSIHF